MPSEITDHYLVCLTLLRTTSTEQCARAATAAEILPRTNLSRRLLKPAEPTNMQSASHSSAAVASSFFGSPSRISLKTLMGVPLNIAAHLASVSLSLVQSSSFDSSIVSAN